MGKELTLATAKEAECKELYNTHTRLPGYITMGIVYFVLRVQMQFIDEPANGFPKYPNSFWQAAGNMYCDRYILCRMNYTFISYCFHTTYMEKLILGQPWKV